MFGNEKTIIENLMQYDIKEFREYKKKEKLMYYIKSSYDKIKKEICSSKAIKLQPMSNMSSGELNAYKQILLKYLNIKGYNGELRYNGYEYNKQYRAEVPCHLNPYPFYVYEFDVN